MATKLILSLLLEIIAFRVEKQYFLVKNKENMNLSTLSTLDVLQHAWNDVLNIFSQPSVGEYSAVFFFKQVKKCILIITLQIKRPLLLKFETFFH